MTLAAAELFSPDSRAAAGAENIDSTSGSWRAFQSDANPSLPAMPLQTGKKRVLEARIRHCSARNPRKSNICI
jgi:hypothetical protein